MIKVCVCCIGRLENRYINEYLNHYYNMGVDKIVIYDNNYNDEEYFEDVVDNSLIGSKLDIIDYRNKTNCQLKAYSECYDMYGSEYDWILFIDCGDEYLYMNGFENIKDFLCQDKFKSFDMIHINLMTFGDNDKVYYEDKPLKERFKYPVYPLDWKKNYNISENCHVSSIIRGGLELVVWGDTPHTPINHIKCCNASGVECDSASPFCDIDFRHAYFKHYTTKTIEEWFDIKVKRGFPDGNKDYFKKKNPLEEFFKTNRVTEEKFRYIEENIEKFKDYVTI